MQIDSSKIADTIDQGSPVAATPVPPVRYDVFLCHNRLDKPLVKDVADALQMGAGILFFLDEFSIPASVEFMQFIRDEMGKSAACAIFLGRNGWGPTHIEEARLALQLKAERPEFRVIPVNLPGAAPSAWEEIFGPGQRPPYNWVEMSGAGDDAACAKLTEAVHGRFSVKAAGPENVTPYYIRRQANLWDRSGRSDNSLLIGGKLLQEAQAQAAKNPAFVSVNSVPAFLARCSQWERNRLRAWLAIATVAVTIAGGLAVAAVLQRNEAFRQREVATRNAQISQVRSLASLAVRSIGEDRADERALLLARQSYLLDLRTGSQSSYIVSAALSEVLSTPYLSSLTRLPDNRIPARISPSGAFMLSGDGKAILTGPIIDPEGRAAVPRDVELDVPIADFLVGTDGLLVATKEGEVETRTIAAPTRRERLLASLGKVPSILAVSRDGSRAVALTDDFDLTSMDLASGSPPKHWKLPQRVEKLAVSANAMLVAALDERGALRLYSWGATRPIAIYPKQDDVNSFEFGTGTAVLVGERGGAIWLWDARNPSASRRRLDNGDPRGSVDSIAVSADGLTAATASGAITPGISIWNISPSGASIGAISGPRSVAKLAFTSDKRFLISALLSGEIRYWRLKGAGASRAVLARDWQPFPLPGRLYSVARDPRGDSFLVGGDHGVIQKWTSPLLEGAPTILAAQRRAALELVPDKSRFEANGRNFLSTGHVMAVAYSKDGTRFATVDPYGFGLVWTAARETLTPTLIQSASTSHPSLSVAFSPNGQKLAIGATSSLTVVHQLDASGASVGRITISSGGDDTVRGLVFTGDDELLVGDDKGRLVRWHLGEEPRPTFVIASGPLITALSLLRDQRIAVGRGNQVDLIDPNQTSPRFTTLSKGLGEVYAIAGSDDGKLLAVGFADGIVRIWSLLDATRQPVTLHVHRDVVRSVTFDRSGETLVSVGDDGMIRSSTVGPARLASLGCDVLWRDLDPDETRSFFGPASPPSLPTCGVSRP